MAGLTDVADLIDALTLVPDVRKDIEELREKFEEVKQLIKREEDVKNHLQNEIQLIRMRLDEVKKSLPQRRAEREKLECTISESEASYDTIMKNCLACLRDPPTRGEHS